ncbi:hypothetical protein [Streptomyces antimycoticus]|uniref:hypothetical protein n=1 Tax=Streptomyces antimycoticus TaxID=68175 RepID=UPI001D13F79B|nr:hypothetical protein [Streptomyces antimycoticus]
MRQQPGGLRRPGDREHALGVEEQQPVVGAREQQRVGGVVAAAHGQRQDAVEDRERGPRLAGEGGQAVLVEG